MNLFKTFYLNKITFIVLGVCILLFSVGLLSEISFVLGKLLLFLLFLAVLGEGILLYSGKSLVNIKRKLPHRLSNGDENTVTLHIKSSAPFALKLIIYEDLPEQLQIREWKKQLQLNALANLNYSYNIKPTVRGSYQWRNTYALATTNIAGFVSRKITFEAQMPLLVILPLSSLVICP